MNTIEALTEAGRDHAWRAWQERNHLRDLHGVALRAKLTKCASMVVLLLAVVFWSYAADYQVLLRFVVCAGAVRVAFLAAAVRRYNWASLFAGMAVLYNPVFPLFVLSGRVGFFLVIASITAFAASLFLLKPRLTPSVAGHWANSPATSGGALRDAIEAGSILIERGALMPDSWLPQGGPCSSGWISVGKLDRSGLEASIRQAGWTFFFLAGEIRATVFGFDKQEAVLKAVKRLIRNVKAQHLNCLEITRVAMSSFLGVPYVTVAGHARHIQEGLVLSRTTTLPDKAGSPPAVRSSIRRQRSEITEEPLFAEEAVAAWEDEGGAPGHMGGRVAA